MLSLLHLKGHLSSSFLKKHSVRSSSSLTKPAWTKSDTSSNVFFTLCSSAQSKIHGLSAPPLDLYNRSVNTSPGASSVSPKSIMANNDNWTCCQCGAENNIGNCPVRCPLCPHEKCDCCKVGQPTSLFALHLQNPHQAILSTIPQAGDDMVDNFEDTADIMGPIGNEHIKDEHI